jgi:hypothetical protein
MCVTSRRRVGDPTPASYGTIHTYDTYLCCKRKSHTFKIITHPSYHWYCTIPCHTSFGTILIHQPHYGKVTCTFTRQLRIYRSTKRVTRSKNKIPSKRAAYAALVAQNNIPQSSMLLPRRELAERNTPSWSLQSRHDRVQLQPQLLLLR